MNYLAHIFLSREEPSLMVGNFIADKMTRKEYLMLDKDLQAGVDLHRQIDFFTDRHPAFRKGVTLLRPRHRKYAPVVLDILNDHLLCLQWDRFSDRRFRDFEDLVYDTFSDKRDLLPPGPRRQVSILLEHRYLRAYHSREAMQGVLRRMDQRAVFESRFEDALHDLNENQARLESLFIALMDNLLEFTDEKISARNYPSK